MTYSLDTLKSGSTPQRNAPPGRKFAHEIGLIIGAVALVFWLLALLSHAPGDAAWSTSGSGASGAVRNWGGKLGAWLADSSFYIFGYSVWWCVLAAGMAWLSSLSFWLRSNTPAGSARTASAVEDALPHAMLGLPPRAIFWLGLALLLMASCLLEWSRLHRFEARLPGHAGGVLGYMVGGMAVKWLGFTGSALVGIAVGVVGAAWTFGFSWARWADGLGAWLYQLWEQRREKREVAQDIAMGTQAAREREEVVSVERAESEELHPAPIAMPVAQRPMLEPTFVDVLVDVPQSARVAKERQKPLFS